jgi:hypothetical protein
MVMSWVSPFDSFMGTLVRPEERCQTDSKFAVVWRLFSWSVEMGRFSNASYPEKILTE